MIREKTYVTLSDKDEHRLTIYDVPEEETQRLTHGARSAFLTITAITAVVLVVLAALFFWQPNIWVRAFLVMFLIVDVFMFAVNVNMYRKNKLDFQTRWHYIEVELMEKLPIEKASLKETRYRKDLVDFYPAKAKDTKRNYVTTIYLQKEEYDHFEAGKIMHIYVSLKNDRKQK